MNMPDYFATADIASGGQAQARSKVILAGKRFPQVRAQFRYNGLEGDEMMPSTRRASTPVIRVNSADKSKEDGGFPPPVFSFSLPLRGAEAVVSVPVSPLRGPSVSITLWRGRSVPLREG
jgi:hypothetical protein